MPTDLFTSHTVGALALPNRVVMAPMTRSRASADHIPTAIMAEHYAARADGGLLISEGTAPNVDGCGYPRIPGIWSEEQISSWKVVTDAVHAAGGRIAIQLMHTGRVSHTLNMPEGATVLAPSAVPHASEKMYTDQSGLQDYPVPRAMTEAEVEASIEAFVSAARNARAAGFDAVELHGANGYLIDQFLSPNTNQRDDRWGGDREGRSRFALEVARRVAEAIGADRLGIRLSPGGRFNGIEPWDSVGPDFVWLTRKLGALGLAFLHIVDLVSMGGPEVPDALKAELREAFPGTVILSGGYDRARADADLAAGKGDLVAFGRAFLANADLVTRLREGSSLNAADMDTFYTPGPEGYNDYPTL